MLFLTILTRVVYWYMDHNNPAKLATQEKELQKVKKCMKTVKFAEPEREEILINTATGSDDQLREDLQKGGMNSEKIESTEFKCTGCTNEDTARRRQWEQNEIDYMGLDSFDNIMAKLDQSLAK